MQSEDTPRVTPAAYALLVLGSVGYFLFLFVWFLLPAFLTPVIAELGLSNTQAGVVTGAVPVTYIPLALVSGLVVDRVGAPNAIGVGLVVLGGAQTLRAGATGFPALLAGTVLLGVGGTAITFGLPKLVSSLFPAERIGSMSSVYVVGSSLGTGAAFAFGRPYLGPLAGGWRPLFHWSGLGVVGFGLAWLVVSTLLWRRVDTFWADADADDQGFTLGSVRADVGAVFSHPQLRLLVVIGTMQLFLSHGLQAWITTALEDRGLAAALAATIASLFVLARIGGTVTIPTLSDRFGRRRVAVVGCGALGTLGLGGLLVAGPGVGFTVAVVALVGVGLGGLSTLVRAIPIELDGIGPRLTGTATGLIYAVGEVGGFAGPFLVGSLRDVSGSFTPGFALLAAGGLVIVVAGYAMAEPSTRTQRSTSG